MCSIALDDKDGRSIEKFINKQYNMLDISSLLSCSSQILCLPEKIAQLSEDTTELEISSNDFPEFTELLHLLKNLKKLQIQNNAIKTVPSDISNLHNLHTLNLSNNQLEELPETICDLKNLEVLNLSHNQLKDLPLSCAKLQKLKNLDISYNIFKSIPLCIARGMGTIKVLDISNNPQIRMNVIPYSKYLEKFYAKNNKNCPKFPDWILTPKFFNLRDINLDNTTFDVYTYAGKEGKLYITSLSMNHSNLSNPVLEKVIKNMISLEKISLSNRDDNVTNSGNIFNEIPIHILKNPELITEVYFRSTTLSSIPKTIKQLCNLKILDVGLNCLFWLPEEFCDLEKLEVFEVDNNGLIMLPDNIGNLKSLKVIKAQNNNLEKLPETLKNLKKLKCADFYNNKIAELPNFILEMTNLEGLDMDHNFFVTDSLKIGENSYSELRNAYLSIDIRKDLKTPTIWDDRAVGPKKQASVKTNADSNYGYSYNSSEGSFKLFESVNNESDDNWDEITNSDDEFDPEVLNFNTDAKNKYDKGKTKDYVYQTPEGFCPADLHLSKVSTEVKSLLTYGSLPTFKIEEGQFDDA